MRLWTIHPRHLDAAGLVALWREGLLARAVLRGKTRGYHHHPQLIRFRESKHPLTAIDSFLLIVYREARRRGYRFDRALLGKGGNIRRKIVVTAGQVSFEWHHLRGKLRARDPERYRECGDLERPDVHPLFRVIPGPRAEWEKRAR